MKVIVVIHDKKHMKRRKIYLMDCRAFPSVSDDMFDPDPEPELEHEVGSEGSSSSSIAGAEIDVMEDIDDEE